MLKNWWDTAQYGAKNLFRSAAREANTLVSTAQYYQVKAGDTLGSVAKYTNKTIADIVNANHGMKTIPPVGSFINAATFVANAAGPPGNVVNAAYTGLATGMAAGNALSQAAFPELNSVSKSSYGTLNQMSNPLAAVPYVTGNAQADAWIAANPGVTTGNSFSPTGNYRGGGGNFPATTDFVLRQFAAYINKTGTLPFAVSDQAMTAAGQTPQSLMSVGYVKNPMTGDWTIDPSKTGQGKSDPYSEVRSVAIRHDNGRVKWITPEEAALRNRQARKHRNDKVLTPAQADNAASVPSTTLNVQIGSG
jgi:LysM repeat protein